MKKLLILFFSFFCCVEYIYPQCAVKNDAIQSGEHLIYDLKYNWKFIWVDAGTARMSVQQMPYHGKEVFRTSLVSVSNSKVDFFFKMRDTLLSICTTKLEPIYFRKGALEGKRYSVDQAWFSYKNGECICKQIREQRDKEDVVTIFKDNNCIHDMLNILLQARSFDPTHYVVGDKINFLMATGKKVELQTLIYRGKKIFKAENNVRYRCLLFSLVEYKHGKEKEVITFYVTDDKNHLPVRLDLYLNFGSAKAYLKVIKGNKYPLTSIVR